MLIGLFAYYPLGICCRRRLASAALDAFCPLKRLPARFSRLTWMASIVVPPTPASTAKTIPSTTPGTLCFRFGLVNRQRPPAKISSVERRHGLVGLTGIDHFHEPESTGAAG